MILTSSTVILWNTVFKSSWFLYYILKEILAHYCHLLVYVLHLPQYECFCSVFTKPMHVLYPVNTL